MASIILEKKLRRHRNDLLATLRKKNRLPKVIIGAEFKEIKEVGGSGDFPIPMASKLEKELIKIAPLGAKGHKYYIGCCCEIHSSNKIILKKPSTPIRKIDFTKAIRTFSGQVMRRCQNCKIVFG